MNQNDFLTDEQLDDLLADAPPAGKAFPVRVREKMIASMRAEIFPLEDNKQPGTAQTTTQITSITPFWGRVARWLSGGFAPPALASLCLAVMLSGAGVLAYTVGVNRQKPKIDSLKNEAAKLRAEILRQAEIIESYADDDLPMEVEPVVSPDVSEETPPKVKLPKPKPTPIQVKSPNIIPVYAFPDEIRTDRARAYTDFALPDNAVQALISVRLDSDETFAGRVALKSDSGTEVPCSVLPQNNRNLLIQVNARALVNGWYTLRVELNGKTLLGNIKPKRFWSRIFITKG
jgi:hypothetical protein